MQEVLIKTFKKSDYQYAQALLNNGELFFQHVDAYRNMEGNCQRNDFEEGEVVENISAYIDPNVNSFYIGQPNGKQFFVDWAAVKKLILSCKPHRIADPCVSELVMSLIG